MQNVFAMIGSIGIDNKKAIAGLDDTVKKSKTATEKVQDYFSKTAQKIGEAFSADKLIDYTKMVISAASNAKELQAKFEGVFGDLEDIAKGSLETLGSELGMLPTRIKEPFTDAALQFKTLGMSAEDAMEIAKVAVTSAADAAAFYNISYDQANDSLNSFIEGNYKSGEAIGVFADETQIAAFAVKNGLITTSEAWSNLDEATKRATRLEYVSNVQALAGAAGQAANESGNYENTMDNLKQAWEDFLAIIGGPILEPIMTGLQGLVEWVVNGTEKLKGFETWLSNNETTIGLFAIALGTITGLLIAYDLKVSTSSIILGVWNTVAAIGTTITTALGAAFSFLTSPIGLVILAIGAAIAIGYLLISNWEWIKETTLSVFASISTGISQAVDMIIGFFGNIINFVMNSWQTLLSFIVAPFASAFKVLSDNFEGFKIFISDTVSKVKEFFSNMGNGIASIVGGIRDVVADRFNRVKDAIMNPIEAAKNFVGDMIGKIKGFFNFNWSLPSLKLPHFKVKGSANPLDWFTQGIPTIGVEWYAKGGIMTRPTLFGFDGKNFMGGGEAGPEAALPLNEKNLAGIGYGIAAASGFTDSAMNEAVAVMTDEQIERFAMVVSSFIARALEGFGIYVDKRSFARLVREV